MAEEPDIWSKWLLLRRTGGDPDMRRRVVENLRPVRDQVIEGARISPGARVLDVGCGDGMVGFGVLERFADAHVVFCDISAALIEECRNVASEAGVTQRSSFVVADAQELGSIPADSVDAVTLRSVLMYVPDKLAAHRECFRVLKPGGWLSYFEPISPLDREDRPDGFWGYDPGPVRHLVEKVLTAFSRNMPPGDAMMGFTERDLAAFAEDAGFDPVHLTIRIDCGRVIPDRYRMTWEQWLGQTGNPKIPSVGEAIALALTSSEQAEFVAWMKPQVESGRGIFRMGHAFVTAQKPP